MQVFADNALSLRPPLLFDEWSLDPEIRQRQIEMVTGRRSTPVRQEPRKRRFRERISDQPALDTWGGRYEASLPPKPLCADDFELGVYPVQRSIAVNAFRYVQHNTALRYGWLLADIDRPGSVWTFERAGLPAPNVIMENPENGHVHLGWRLVFAVSGARPDSKQMRFFTGIERGIVRRLQADRAFSQAGLVKNALHPDWIVHRLHDAPHELAALACAIDKREMRVWTKAEKQAGLGRNVDMFNALRKIAYREVLRFKADGKSRPEFFTALFVTAADMNRTMGFYAPLPVSELRSIAKSVAVWTWQRFDEEEFRELQRERGTRGHAKRWNDHVTAAEQAEAAGVSRRTWYRRLKMNSQA